MTTRLGRLKGAKSSQDVARLLGFKPPSLAYILYKKPSLTKYTDFTIPKRSGGERTISAPYPPLKLLQTRLSELLQDCIDEINKTRKIESALSHGFRRQYSIITNASVHRRRRYVFNIDIEDFFGSINFGRVRGFFIKNRHFELTPTVATILAQIACHNNALPQGSPCSPVLSNLIGHILDIRLARLAQKVGCNYSRYADDLTFSTSKLVFPVQVARLIEGTEHQWQIGLELQQIILKSGFSINASKTRMQYASSRQDVTGLVVNTKVNVPAEYRRTARAMVHRLLKTGKFQIGQIKGSGNTMDGTMDQLNGVLSFVDSVRSYGKARKRLPVNDSFVRLYRRFLFYRNFYAASSPLIVCEGKSDNIYIKAAIRSLADDYPRLAVRKPNGSVSILVQFFRHAATARRILGLGGTGGLGTLIQQYESACARIEAPGMKYPVILVVDNDDGAQNVYNAVKAATKAAAKPDGSQPFYPVTKNLYVVPTPLGTGSKSVIEDMFDENTKSIKVSGKSFNPGSTLNTNTEYGKVVFAEQVVRKNLATINFEGFRPLLDRIDEAIGAYIGKSISAPAG